jgi:hypothetical protein
MGRTSRAYEGVEIGEGGADGPSSVKQSSTKRRFFVEK